MTRRDALEEARRYYPRFLELSDAVCGNWPGAIRCSVEWDSYFRVLTCARHSRSYTDIYGSPLLQFAKCVREVGVLAVQRRGIRRYHAMDFRIKAPPDSIVIRPFVRRGPVIASSHAGLVLKMFVKPDQRPCKLDNEISALRIGQQSGLAHHIPKVVEESTECGVRWMVSELVPNLRPFSSSNIPLMRKQWFSFVSSELIPFLVPYYKASGLTDADPDEIVESVSGGIDDDFSGLIASWIKSRRPKGSLPRLPSAVVHGDVSPAHVHRNAAGWKLIDWGDSRRRPVLFEFLRGPWDFPSSHSPANESFWRWLVGRDTDESAHPLLATRFKATLDVLRRLGYPVPSLPVLRYLILAAMLEELVVWRSTKTIAGERVPPRSSPMSDRFELFRSAAISL